MLACSSGVIFWSNNNYKNLLYSNIGTCSVRFNIFSKSPRPWIELGFLFCDLLYCYSERDKFGKQSLSNYPANYYKNYYSYYYYYVDDVDDVLVALEEGGGLGSLLVNRFSIISPAFGFRIA